MTYDNYDKHKSVVFALQTSDKKKTKLATPSGLGLGFDYQEMHELNV